MGLTWVPKVGRTGWEGLDGSDYRYAHVVLDGHGYRWTAFITSEASGVERGIALRGFTDPGAAMDAADRFVVAYVDDVGMEVVREEMRQRRLRGRR